MSLSEIAEKFSSGSGSWADQDEAERAESVQSENSEEPTKPLMGDIEPVTEEEQFKLLELAKAEGSSETGGDGADASANIRTDGMPPGFHGMKLRSLMVENLTDEMTSVSLVVGTGRAQKTLELKIGGEYHNMYESKRYNHGDGPVHFWRLPPNVYARFQVALKLATKEGVQTYTMKFDDSHYKSASKNQTKFVTLDNDVRVSVFGRTKEQEQESREFVRNRRQNDREPRNNRPVGPSPREKQLEAQVKALQAKNDDLTAKYMALLEKIATSM